MSIQCYCGMVDVYRHNILCPECHRKHATMSDFDRDRIESEYHMFKVMYCPCGEENPMCENCYKEHVYA
jgi:hypothetical protein